MKTNKYLAFGFAGVIGIGLASITLISQRNSPHIPNVNAGDSNVNSDLNESNKVEGKTWATCEISYGDFTTIHYDDANSVGGHHVQIGANGKIYKLEPSYGLATITITSAGNGSEEGSYKLETDYVNTFDSDAKYEVWQKVGSTTTFNVIGNYWRISNVSGGYTSINITSITVNYGCKEEAVRPASTGARVTGFRKENGRAFTLQDIGGTHYFTIRGTQSDGFLSPRELRFYTDGDKGMDCEYIRYRQNDGFEAFFNVDDYYASNSGTFYGHLNVRGAAWNGSDGNVGLTSDIVYSEIYNVGSKYIGIKEGTWSIGGDTKYHHVHLEEIPNLVTSASISLVGGKPHMVLSGICDDDYAITADVQTIDNGWKKTDFSANSSSSAGTWSIDCDLSQITGENLVNCSYSIHYKLDGKEEDTFYYHGLELSSAEWDGHTYTLAKQERWNSDRLVLVIS